MAGNELTPSNQNNSLTQSISGKIEKYGEPVIEVIGSIYFNVKKWWNGEITGKRCAKSIIDDGAKAGGAIGGAAGGAWIGSAIGGPIGMAKEASLELVCRSCNSKCTLRVIDGSNIRFTQDCSARRCLQILGTRPEASNDQINKRYRQLALVYHPDKEGGREDKFIKLHSYVCIIRASREYN